MTREQVMAAAEKAANAMIAEAIANEAILINTNCSNGGGWRVDYQTPMGAKYRVRVQSKMECKETWTDTVYLTCCELDETGDWDDEATTVVYASWICRDYRCEDGWAVVEDITGRDYNVAVANTNATPVRENTLFLDVHACTKFGAEEKVMAAAKALLPQGEFVVMDVKRRR